MSSNLKLSETKIKTRKRFVSLDYTDTGFTFIEWERKTLK